MLKLNRIEHGTSSEVIEKIFYVLLPDARTVLDVTYGRGNFWNWSHKLELTTNDIVREADYNQSFTKLQFESRSFDVVVFDPPYQTDPGKSGSVMSNQFGYYKTIPELETAVRLGIKEVWRVARKGIIVKVQDYIHGQRLVEMTEWIRIELKDLVRDALLGIPLYDVVHLESTSRIDAHTLRPLSVRSNSTTFMIFRKDTPVHKRRYF